MNRTGTDIEWQAGCCKTDIVETNENKTRVSQMKGLTLLSQAHDSEKMASVTHFEVYGEEPGKLADSYRETLGWELEQMPYWRAQTGAN